MMPRHLLDLTLPPSTVEEARRRLAAQRAERANQAANEPVAEPLETHIVGEQWTMERRLAAEDRRHGERRRFAEDPGMSSWGVLGPRA